MADELCKSCQGPLTGNFCANCGEKSFNKRLVFGDLLSDFMSNLFELEIPLLRTIKELTIKPGIMCRKYIQGIRKPYYKPFQYYILTLALFYLVFYAFGLEMSDFSKGFQPELPEGPFADQTQVVYDQIAQVMNDNSRLVQFVVIPFMAFFSWLVFKKSGFNYTENFVLSLYLAAHASLIGLIIVPLSKIDFTFYFIVTGSVGTIYQIWAYHQFFQLKLVAAVLKGLLVYVLTFVTVGLVNMTIGIILVRIFMDLK